MKNEKNATNVTMHALMQVLWGTFKNTQWQKAIQMQPM